MSHPILSLLFVFLGIISLSAQTADTSGLAQLYEKKRLEIKERYGNFQQDEAIKATEELIAESAQQIGSSSLVHAYNIQFLGNLYANKGDFIKTLEYQKKALTIAEKHIKTDTKEMALFIEPVGIAYANAGEINQALIYYEKVAQIYTQIYPPKAAEWFYFYGSLCFIYSLDKENFNKSFEYANLQLEIATTKFPEKSAERVRSNEIMAQYWYVAKGHKKNEKDKVDCNKKMLEWQHKSLKAHLDFYGPNDHKTANAYLNLGAFYKDSYPKSVQNLELSRKYSLEAAHIMENLYNGLHPDLSITYRNIAGTYFGGIPHEERDYKQIFYYRNKALSAVLPNFRPHPDSIFAIPDFTKAVNLVCLKNRNVYQALITKTANFKSYCAHQENKELLTLGLKLAEAGALFIEQKIKTVTQQEDEAELLSHFDFFYSFQIYYCNKLFQLTQDNKYLNQAFQCAEKNKSVVLLRSLKKEGLGENTMIPTNEKKQEKILKRNIANTQNELLTANQNNLLDKIPALREKLFEANKDYDAYVLNIKETYPTFFNLQYNQEVASIKDIQDGLLDESTMLIELHLSERGEDDLTVFAIYKDHATSIVIPESIIKEFNKNIEKNLLPFKDFNTISIKDKQGQEKALNKFVDISHKIYKDILQLDKVLTNPNIKRIIVVADKSYGYIPFELLIKEKPKTIVDYKSLDFLIKDYTISYAYSASVLLQHLKNKKKTRSQHKILGFAASYNDTISISEKRSASLQKLRKKLIPLAGVEKELKSLEELYSGDYYFGKEANESNFKNANFENYAIIHLAMHGLLNEENAMSSSLAFTEDNNSIEDNFLHAYELMNMSINADLVVLSACETGLGVVKKSEGIMSLARTFAYAGVPSMVMTLWPVNDHSTAIIMKDFYKNLSEGLPKDEALRQAKLTYLNTAKGISEHPLFWGPYILVGDVSPVELYQPRNLGVYGGLAAVFLVIIGLIFWKKRNRKKS